MAWSPTGSTTCPRPCPIAGAIRRRLRPIRNSTSSADALPTSAFAPPACPPPPVSPAHLLFPDPSDAQDRRKCCSKRLALIRLVQACHPLDATDLRRGRSAAI